MTGGVHCLQQREEEGKDLMQGHRKTQDTPGPWLRAGSQLPAEESESHLDS